MKSLYFSRFEAAAPTYASSRTSQSLFKASDLNRDGLDCCLVFKAAPEADGFSFGSSNPRAAHPGNLWTV